IRIYNGDARDIIGALPDASLGRVFILFPDPWPKLRHHKRRFIQMEMLDHLARVMKTGAELRFASDDAGYVEWTLERLMAHPSFEWIATRASDWQTRPADWPQTRYEAKELHGKPVFLKFAPVYRGRLRANRTSIVKCSVTAFSRKKAGSKAGRKRPYWLSAAHERPQAGKSHIMNRVRAALAAAVSLLLVSTAANAVGYAPNPGPTADTFESWQDKI